MLPRIPLHLLFVGILLLLSAPAFAQAQPPSTPPAAASTLTPEETAGLRALLDTLSNDESRAAFLARLRTLVDSAASPAPVPERDDWLAGATESLGAFSGSLLTVLGEIENLPAEISGFFERLTDPAVLRGIGWAVLMLALTLAAAFIAEQFAKWLLARPRRAVEARVVESFPARLLMLVVHTLLAIVPIAAFAAAGFGALALVELSFMLRLALVTVINANVLARLLIVAGRAVLTPSVPHMRLFAMDDESAAYGYLWVRRFALAAIYGYFGLRAAWVLGMSRPTYVFFGDLLALLLAGMCIIFILQVRSGVARRLRRLGRRNGRGSRLRDGVADSWHVLAIAYVVVAYLVWVLDIGRGFDFIGRATLLSVLTLAFATLVGTALLRGFDRVFRLKPELRERFPLLESRANRYLPKLRGVLKAFYWTLVGLVLLEIWGVEPFAWLASEAGQGMLGRLISIGVVLLLGAFAWEIGGAFGERLRAKNPSSTRLKTLLPFLENAFRVVLLTLAGLVVLSELGVDIAPLIAGAGVIGLAIGFGAQTLVKDVITGVFILMEDTLSVGDVVEVGSHSGLVEKVTIRTVHLRDFDGNVHSVPFGEVQTIKNMSKDFAFAVIDVRIAYRENIDEALAVMAEVAADMAANGPLAEVIVAPFEVVGVEGLEESGVWLRGRFKTRPLGQWNVRREFYRRIKAAFEARGIQIPHPHRTVYLGVDKKGNAPPLRVVNQEADEAEKLGLRRGEAARAARTPGPLIEEHPGARERLEEDEAVIPPLQTRRR
jgi:small conductance mechanosensitive channel